MATNSIEKLLRNNWSKINSLTALSVALKLGVGMVSSKIISIYIGPTGIALLGNFRNFFTTIETLATLGFQNGIITNIASSKKDNDALSRQFSTIFITISIATLLLSIGLFSMANLASNYVFGTANDFENVFKITALLLPLYIATAVLVLIFNGLEKHNLVLYLSIAGTLIGLMITIYLTTKFGLKGTLLSTIVTQASQFFVVFYYFKYRFKTYIDLRFKYFDCQIIKKLGAFTIMTAFTALVVPTVFLSIRKHVTETLGLEAAGYWTTMDLLAGYYMLFISTIIVVFYLPKLSVATSGHDTKILFFQYYTTTIPLFSIGLLVLFFLKTIVIELFFTSKFWPIKDLFLYQLMGDFFKALSMILAFNLIAKKQVFIYLFLEVISVLIMYFSSTFFINKFKIEGVVMAHLLTYFTYFIMMLFANRSNIFCKKIKNL